MAFLVRAFFSGDLWIQLLVEYFNSLVDIPFSRHENEDVAGVPFVAQRENFLDSKVNIGVVFLFVAAFFRRSIAYLHRVGSTGNLYDRSLVKVGRKFFSINRS